MFVEQTEIIFAIAGEGVLRCGSEKVAERLLHLRRKQGD